MELGFITLGGLVIVQLITFAYGYGKLTQKVKDISQRLNDFSHRIEKIENREKS